jgi:hypothetical protein
VEGDLVEIGDGAKQPHSVT